MVGTADFALVGEDADYQDVPALIQDEEPEAAEDKVQHVDRARLVLHGADGNKCGCDLCKAVKHRRHGAKAGSHPHSEEQIRQTDGAHSVGCVAVHWDVQDYGAEAAYLHGTCYDLLGYCVTSALILCILMKSKDIQSIEAAAQPRIGPNESFSWTRTNDAPELNNA